MTNGDFVLGRDERNEIMKAVKAIERQLKALGGPNHQQVLYVISMNLAIIHSNVANLPRVSPN